MQKNFLNKLSDVASSLGFSKAKVDSAISGLGGKVSKAASSAVNNKTKSFTFNGIPENLEALKALPEAGLTDVYATAALTVLALARYEQDKDAALEMLDFLKGPDDLSNLERQHIANCLMDGKSYKLRSYFEGAVPGNNYTPSQPLTVKVTSNPYSFENENWATLWLQSGGADSPRPVKLRQKPSTRQWFLSEIQFLSDIRVPVEQDKWA